MRVALRSDHALETGSTIPSLTIGREYEVIGIEADYFRIIDNTGDPILFPPVCFEIIDATEPSFWETSVGDEGERYAYPPCWNRAGFFEDYHDGVEELRRQFWVDHHRLYGRLGAGP